MNDQKDQIEKLDYDILMLKKKLGLLTPEEEERLKELEAKLGMDKFSEIKSQHEETNEMLEANENPFQEQNQLNDLREEYNEVKEDELSERQRSRITDDENFA